MKLTTNMVWLRILVAAAVSVVTAGEVVNGEERQWKLELSSFSGMMDRVSGDWERLGARVFRQRDTQAAPTTLLIGRKEWANYRLRMRARIMEGTGGLLVFFRYRDEDWNLWWSLSGQENIPSGIGENRWGYGRIIPETGIPHLIEKQKWYEISLVIRGREINGYLDGNLEMEYILPNDGTHTTGTLGLGTWLAVAEFEIVELEQFEKEMIPGPPALRGNVLVRGMEEVPIPGAEIKGTFGTINTDHQGQFFVKGLIPGRNVFTIAAPGFVTQRVIFSLEEGENIKAFYLRPRTPIDGGKILFFREYERYEGMPRGDLFVLSLGSGVERNITQRPGAYFSPHWSPDGSMIAFYTLDSREIFITPAGGGQMEKMASGMSPLWSPDGQRLLFLDGKGLWSLKRGETEPVLLFENTTYIKDYSWSPEGNWVLFESQSHIFVVNPDGGELREVAYPGENPVWSPDGKTILFISPRGLVKLDIGDGKEIKIAPRGRFGDLRWSPDGSTIAYRKWDEDPGGIQRPVLYLVGVNGGERYRTFHSIKEGIQEYRWSPLHNELVLLGVREPPMPNTIYHMKVEGKKISPIIDFPATNLQWSPNGQWISFLSQGEAGWDIYMINGDGTGFRKMTDTPEPEFQESWCPGPR